MADLFGIARPSKYLSSSPSHTAPPPSAASPSLSPFSAKYAGLSVCRGLNPLSFIA